MGRQLAIVLYVVAMAAVIVGVDLLFFRNRFWERLIVNIGIIGVRSFLLEISLASVIAGQLAPYSIKDPKPLARRVKGSMRATQ